MVIRDYTPVAVRLALEAHIRPTFLRAETGVSIQKALSTGLAEDGSMGYFNFDKRGLGENLYLSDVYALVESLPGMDFLIVKEFRKQAEQGAAANLVNDVLRMPPDGVATGGDATDISIGYAGHHVGGRPGMSNLSQLESHYEELIYRLLPQLYRSRDSQGELQKFVEMFGHELARLRANIDQLQQDFFIDSCQEWVIPYIGDLVGTTVLFNEGARNRTDVKNTIRWRREKGTLAGLEDIAAQIGDWGARPRKCSRN